VVRRGLRSLLETHPGWSVCAEACNGIQAVAEAQRLSPELAILDIGMPELNGLQAAARIRKAVPQTRVLILTMHDDKDLVRATVKTGAHGYLLKSDAEQDLIMAVGDLMQNKTFFTKTASTVALKRFVDKDGVLSRTIQELRKIHAPPAEERLHLSRRVDSDQGLGRIIGKSKALQAVMEQVRLVAGSDAVVLRLGETGTGKELVARAVHQLRWRADNSIIKMNCAAVPSGLLQSELFGHEKGAFTGAVSKKIGRLELADKGTLFLDEIGEISLELQPKLLRVLQDQEFERLDGTKTLKVDFRLVAATNRDLADSVRENEFRSDLYYRLNVFPIRVPPLRERREDIPLLVQHFVQRFALRMDRLITTIPKKTMDALTRWEWPGNVRELENFIERCVILTQGSVLASPVSELALPLTDGESLESVEREHILRALRASGGQIGGLKGAATRLGLKRTTLQSKLKHFGVDAQKTS
jgi:formate hydrogenlyase transcriptional activator